MTDGVVDEIKSIYLGSLVVVLIQVVIDLGQGVQAEQESTKIACQEQERTSGGEASLDDSEMFLWMGHRSTKSVRNYEDGGGRARQGKQVASPPSETCRAVSGAASAGRAKGQAMQISTSEQLRS